MIFQTVLSILVFSFDYLLFCTLTSCSQVPVVPAVGAHRLSIGPLVLAICLTLTHCRSVICSPRPLCLALLHHLLCLCKKRKNTTKKNEKRKRYMKIFITRQKRKQAANPKQKPKPKPNPKTYFEFCTRGGLSVACQACQPAPRTCHSPYTPVWFASLRNALPIVYIVTVVTAADVGRNGPVFAPLFAVTFNLFAPL